MKSPTADRDPRLGGPPDAAFHKHRAGEASARPAPRPELTLPVSGMTCASCVSHVGGALRSVTGVKAAEVSLAAESARIQIDSARAPSQAELIAAVRSAGYDVPTERVSLRIGGMTCASCVTHVGNALREVSGVLKADVSLAAERAEVSLARGMATSRDLKDAVAGAGYTAEVDEGTLTGPDQDAARRAAELRDMRNKTALSLVVALFAMTAVKWQSVPAFADISPATVNWLLLALATPVQFWAGARFYRSAWGALRHRIANSQNSNLSLGQTIKA
jgi:Cu+-exporting ATPase